MSFIDCKHIVNYLKFLLIKLVVLPEYSIGPYHNSKEKMSNPVPDSFIRRTLELDRTVDKNIYYKRPTVSTCKEIRRKHDVTVSIHQRCF